MKLSVLPDCVVPAVTGHRRVKQFPDELIETKSYK
jgi:hypothetical protein